MPKTAPDQAIGSWEAAQVMGVHFTIPGMKAQRGLLTTRVIESPTASAGDRAFCVYSLDECDKDYHDYVEAIGNNARQRKRTKLDGRAAELKRLKTLPTKIEFDDAIGASEAAKIMGCHFTWPPRMARRGDIVGRMLGNGRSTGGKLWIFSRKSCLANAAAAKRDIADGKKIGRPRRATRK